MAHTHTTSPETKDAVDIAFITVIQEEYEAVRRLLKNPQRDPGNAEQPNQYAWVRGEIERTDSGSYEVVLAMAGSPGTVSGSLATSRTVARWNPRYVLLVGIAGGMEREGLSLGDVVFSSVIRAYEYGKLHEGHFEPRPDFQYRVDGPLHRAALSLKNTPWQKDLGRRPSRTASQSKALAGPIASGDKIVDDVSSTFFSSVAKSFPKLLAVEMEGSGAAAAIDEAKEEGRSVGFLMIRGISDMPQAFASRDKRRATKPKRETGGTKTRDNWKKYAANAAAHFAVYVITHGWPVPPRTTEGATGRKNNDGHKREAARARYLSYLETECGEIQLDGLPADEELGARRLELEKLFVPLHVVRCREEEEEEEDSQIKNSSRASRRLRQAIEPNEKERLFFGDVLEKNLRVALLAPPGGGKSTILKRIALAYAFPDRRRRLDDGLPERKWLPILVRCRDLKTRTTEPFGEILAISAERAEMRECHEAFRDVVDEAISDGSLLLLVDGLDEIGDEGARVAFVQKLHTFLGLNPNVGMVVTSREAGFRAVAAAVARLCARYRLAEFNNKDITRLTVAWHREIVGNTTQVIKDAEELATSICKTDRVLRLARNPLLLTTLLLVRRWVGELPQRRGVLYQKAIEVLLMSWNSSAHEKLEASEALPQLGFLAYTMMKEGVQQISEQRLRAVLADARLQMDDIYAYTRISVEEFVRRVEHRSSLLVQQGHTIEQGRLWPVYEFRHLTFQEYLAAHAIAEGHYPGRIEGDTILGILKDHVDLPAWRETVSLSAVLAGRNAKSLVELLTTRCESECRHSVVEPIDGSPEIILENSANPANLLARCLIDEVPLPPTLAERAIRSFVRANSHLRGVDSAHALARSKYREVLATVATDELVHNSDDFPPIGSVVGELGCARLRDDLLARGESDAFDALKLQLEKATPPQKGVAVLTIMKIAHLACRYVSPPVSARNLAQMNLPVTLEPLLYAPEEYLVAATAWAYWWLARSKAITKQAAMSILPRLAELWIQEANIFSQRFAGFAIESLPLIDRDSLSPPPSLAPDLAKKLQNRRKPKRDDYATFVLAYYWRQPWSDKELREHIASADSVTSSSKRELLKALSPESANSEAQLRRIARKG
ncbi:hypothetical protein NVS55_32035 [Myxococcus stipitatus]|uniref:phosphorylase family protein n=1 Tax=Myxococcus stipitatus TaxID=83455 RepID=UPI003144DAE7